MGAWAPARRAKPRLLRLVPGPNWPTRESLPIGAARGLARQSGPGHGDHRLRALLHDLTLRPPVPGPMAGHRRVADAVAAV